MKIHYLPKTILIARPSISYVGVEQALAEYGMKLEDWKIKQDDQEGDLLVEFMGRLCYGSFGERQGRVGTESYMENILSSGHGSIMEHANWSFLIARCGRGYTHQQVRHRAGFAYSQESTHFIRYGEEGQEPGICVTGISTELQTAFISASEKAIKAYEQLWKDIQATFPEGASVKKIVSGSARGILPNALESRIGITANARALRHFCEMRGTPNNTLEIRLVACQLASIMKIEASAMFQDFIFGENGGYPTVISKYRKV
jgi:thymidylate synthase (FAD)